MKGRTLTDSPVIFLEGNATATGTYWVTVTAVDNAGRRATARFSVVIHSAYCTFNVNLPSSPIEWGVTTLVYPMANAPATASEAARELSFLVGLTRYCRGTPSDVNITRFYVEGFLKGITLGINVSTTGFYANRTFIGVQTRNLILDDSHPSVTLAITLRMTDPFRVSRPHPGVTYPIRISAMSDSGEVKSGNITLRVFHRVPKLNITSLRPVSQFPNPHHSPPVTGGSDLLLVMGKQTIFRFNYTLDFPYAIKVVLRLCFPNHEWDWRIYETSYEWLETMRRYEYSWAYPPPGGASGEYIIEETFILTPTREPVTRFFFAEKLTGTKIWCPAPKTSSPSVTIILVKKGNLVLDPSQPLPFLEANRERISLRERFVTLPYEGYLRLGYFIMDSSNFTLEQRS